MSPALRPVIMPPVRSWVPPPRQRSVEEIAAEREHAALRAELRDQECKNSSSSHCEAIATVWSVGMLGICAFFFLKLIQSLRR